MSNEKNHTTTNYPKQPDLRIISASIEAHKERPEITIQHHKRHRQIELAKSLQTRHAIYLDLKFWIGLREAQAIGHANHTYSDLLSALRQAVATGLVFCPISDSCFLEVFKQTDPVTRRKTVELIDELSLGVTIIPSDLRIGTEIAHLMHVGCMPDQVFPMNLLVWTKLCFVLGYRSPPIGMFDKQTSRAIEKAFFDHMWAIPLFEIESLLGNTPQALGDHHENLAQTLTQQNEKHASEIKSYKQAYEHELIGALDLYASRAVNILCSMTPPSVGPPPTRDSDEYKGLEKDCLTFLIAAMQTVAGKDTMRTLHITSCLHAALRWNKRQKFKAHDFFDFQHAAAAVGYCDAFFTERSLCNVLTRSDLALDKLYNCTVVSDPENALHYVQSISSD